MVTVSVVTVSVVSVPVVSVPVVSVPRQGRSQAMAPGWGAAVGGAKGWPCVAAGLMAAVAVPVPRARGWVQGLGSGAGFKGWVPGLGSRAGLQGWQGSFPVALRVWCPRGRRSGTRGPSVTAALLCSVGACASLQLSEFSQKFPKVEISPDKS